MRVPHFVLPAALLALPVAAQPASAPNAVLQGITGVRVITILAGTAPERANCLDDAHLPAIHDAVVGTLAAGGVAVPRQRAQQRLNAEATALVPQPNDTAMPLLTVAVEQSGAMFAGTEVGCSYSIVATLGALVRGGRVAITGTALPETRTTYLWLASEGGIGNPDEVRQGAAATATDVANLFLSGLRAAGFEAPRRDVPGGPAPRNPTPQAAASPPANAAVPPTVSRDAASAKSPPAVAVPRQAQTARGLTADKPFAVSYPAELRQRSDGRSDFAVGDTEGEFGATLAIRPATPSLSAEFDARAFGDGSGFIQMLRRSVPGATLIGNAVLRLPAGPAHMVHWSIPATRSEPAMRYIDVSLYDGGRQYTVSFAVRQSALERRRETMGFILANVSTTSAPRPCCAEPVALP